MRKIISLIFIICINYNYLFSQNEGFVRMYKVEINDLQSIELIEYENQNYKGNIITKIEKGKNQYSFLERIWRKLWDVKNKQIVDKENVQGFLVKKIMSELKERKIETLKDCSLDEECEKLGFLDGGGVSFLIKTETKSFSCYFSEIYPFNGENEEKSKLRKQVQGLISVLYSNINFNKKFRGFLARNPKGWYNYYRSSGNSIVEFKNSKRKNN